MLKLLKSRNFLRVLIWSLVFMHMISSCSHFVKISPEFDGVDEEVKEYYDYLYDMGAPIGIIDESLYNITVGFDDLEDSVIGMCRLTIFPPGNEITLDRTYWKSSSKMRKFMLVSHEILHCYFHKFHNTDLLEDGCPASIMYPQTVHDHCNKRHFGRYVSEILNN